MSSDTRINTIEANIKKNNISDISDSDLIYYLKYYTLNDNLDSVNLKKTEAYFDKIVHSFAYENIFVNTSNYGTIVYCIIGCLIPFYYYFPRFYQLGIVGFLVGILSFMNLGSTVSNLFSIFFSKITYVYYVLTVIIYVFFFIFLNKLNHISLFFISAIIAFIIINYICRLIILSPAKTNKFNKYRASYVPKKKEVPSYNRNLEIVCLEVISRFNLALPSGNMLYSYLTIFKIDDKTNAISDFVINLIAPFFSLFVLFKVKDFIGMLKNSSAYIDKNGTTNPINIFPVVGVSEESKKYLTCQANYILPTELNVELLILDANDFFEQFRKSKTDIIGKIQKSLRRISNELLIKFNPLFSENQKKLGEIMENLKDNKSFKKILNDIKKTYNTELEKYKKIKDEDKIEEYEDKIIKLGDLENLKDNPNYLKEMQDYITKNDTKIPFNDKNKLLEILNSINNVLEIKNKFNKNYEQDIRLAIEVLMGDDNLKDLNNNEKGKIEIFVNKFANEFLENLQVRNQKKELFGYHYNIMTYKVFNKETRLKANRIFEIILSLLSTWLLFAKSLGSPFLIINYIFNRNEKFSNVVNKDNFIWRLVSMGLDLSYFEKIRCNKSEYKEQIGTENKMSFMEKTFREKLITIGWYFLYFLLYLMILMFLTFANGAIYGMALSPQWYNFLFIIAVLINMYMNIVLIKKEKKLLFPNIGYIVGFLIIVLIMSFFIK
jgi:hypothetical protein